MNITNSLVVDTTYVEYIRPDPADKSKDHTSVDTQLFTEILPTGDLKRLWSGDMDSSITDAETSTLYWYHLWQCCLLLVLHRLVERDVLQKCI